MAAPGEPIFWMRIVNKKGELVTLPGGTPLEQDFILAVADQILASDDWQRVADELREDILARKVGLFRTATNVGRKIDLTLHTKLRGMLAQHVQDGIHRAMQNLKDQTVVVA